MLSSCCGSTWQKGRTSNNGIFPLRKRQRAIPIPNAASRHQPPPMRRTTALPPDVVSSASSSMSAAFCSVHHVRACALVPPVTLAPFPVSLPSPV